MPVSIVNNNIFKIRNLKMDYDKTGHYLTMNYGHAKACVVCVCKRGSVTMEDLQLSESELSSLFNGAKLDFPDRGYSLQGITHQQLAAAPQFRNFTMEPPAYVQAWGMGISGNGAITLYLPEDTQEQCVLVPVGYRVQMEDGGMYVWVQREDGYRDGDLMYQVEGHLPVPIPASGLNRLLPMRPGSMPSVMPRPECATKYVVK